MKLLVLRTTNDCNLNCKYCYAALEEKNYMTKELAIESIEQSINPYETLKVQITGGEPLLNWQLVKDIYNFGIKTNRNLIISIQSNGSLITDKIAQDIKRMNLGIGISLDGFMETNENTRVDFNNNNSFPKVLKGLNILKSYEIITNVNAVITKYNVLKLYELLDFIVYQGNIKGLGLDLFRPQGKGKFYDLSPSRKNLIKGLNSLLSRYSYFNSIGIDVEIKEIEKIKYMIKNNLRKDIYCYGQSNLSVAVDPSGDVYPCSAFIGDKNHLLGNIYKESLDALKNKERNCLLEDRSCSKCEYLYYCSGGCPAGHNRGLVRDLDCTLHKIFTSYAIRSLDNNQSNIEI